MHKLRVLVLFTSKAFKIKYLLLVLVYFRLIRGVSELTQVTQM